MRRFLVLALALTAVLLLSRPAQAFHHHTYSQPYAPVYGAPVYGAPAAPLAPGTIMNLVGAGLQLFQALDGSSQTNRILQVIGQNLPQQNAKLPAVDSDVVDTISRVDTALPAVVKRSNDIAALNSSLYQQGVNWKTVTISATTTGGGTSGGTSGPGQGVSGPPKPQQ